MEQQREKKNWVEPELLVLLRIRPEEAVLSFCKRFGSGPNDLALGCGLDIVGGLCNTCPTIAES